jgi:hypothetical protein
MSFKVRTQLWTYFFIFIFRSGLSDIWINKEDWRRFTVIGKQVIFFRCVSGRSVLSVMCPMARLLSTRIEDRGKHIRVQSEVRNCGPSSVAIQDRAYHDLRMISIRLERLSFLIFLDRR